TSKSGPASSSPLTFSLASARPRKIPTGTTSWTMSSCQQAARPSRSRDLKASNAACATSAAVRVVVRFFVAIWPGTLTRQRVGQPRHQAPHLGGAALARRPDQPAPNDHPVGHLAHL